MRIAVTGCSGLVGRALVRALEARGDEVFRVSRTGGDGLRWTPGGEVELEPADGGGLDAVVHLAGAPIAAKRWSAPVKREIEDSRVLGTRLLVEGVGRLRRAPRVVVSASAVAVYGPDRGDEVLDEGHMPEAQLVGRSPADYLTGVVTGWEREVFGARAVGVERIVALRIGIVLSPDGGALERMLPVFRLGLGARLGSGAQWMSWITLGDLVRAILFALDEPELDGPVNAVAPAPVTNRVFTRELARAVRRPSMGFVPRFALRALVGEFADAALFASHRVMPRQLLDADFAFESTELAAGLAAVLGR
jgi:uncharacterized protein (TIGR01777 family)